jgi:hypothetical protein
MVINSGIKNKRVIKLATKLAIKIYPIPIEAS